MSNATNAKTSWFAIITRPRTHLLATIVALTIFIAGVLVGTSLSEYRLLFYIPSIAVLMWWYLAMTSRYRRARGSR